MCPLGACRFGRLSAVVETSLTWNFAVRNEDCSWNVTTVHV
jgi:hypothetical protein